MQHEQYKRSCVIFKDIDKNPDNYLLIHYSCENFYDIKDGHTPRITSIAVYHYTSAQTESFSIHKEAERKHVSDDELELRYDDLEKAMLANFFEYAREHQGYTWIHWNMRDINYGFKSIEHRYAVLGGNAYKILDSKKIDLARLLVQRYGANYIGHPRMEKILSLNNIKPKNYLNGVEEAEAFKKKEYVKLHMSTLSKVDAFEHVIKLAIDNKLKVESKWHEIYGASIQGVYNFCKETWWTQLILGMVTLVLGAVLGKIF